MLCKHLINIFAKFVLSKLIFLDGKLISGPVIDSILNQKNANKKHYFMEEDRINICEVFYNITRGPNPRGETISASGFGSGAPHHLRGTKSAGTPAESHTLTYLKKMTLSLTCDELTVVSFVGTQ